ncbi:hypothetical protein EVA_16215 [gut metagenome]|uniref:Uncharacterized protein n=1 Tax=gut metagenome TaxID=749906 RepID=J9G1I7_9ZZZZ
MFKESDDTPARPSICEPCTHSFRTSGGLYCELLQRYVECLTVKPCQVKWKNDNTTNKQSL